LAGDAGGRAGGLKELPSIGRFGRRAYALPPDLKIKYQSVGESTQNYANKTTDTHTHTHNNNNNNNGNNKTE